MIRPGRALTWARTPAALAGALVALALVAVGLIWLGQDDSTRSSVLPGGSDPGPVHVHGLGVDPSDGTLYIATHSGMYRAPPGESQAQRVGDSRQDTMGFTLLGPNRFLGSGHPDLDEARERRLPPLLGLIESTDRGETWEPISLLGEADFHVLRSRHGRVFGFDVANERLLVSRDAGRTWQERDEPGPLVDLAVHPTKPDSLVASTESGLYRSADEARSWRPLGRTLGLLAWPAIDRLYLVDAGGRVAASRDGGRSWRAVGDIGGQPAAFVAAGANDVYAALHDGTVKRSSDGGRTWRIRSSP